jgi:hypothetical protein
VALVVWRAYILRRRVRAGRALRHPALDHLRQAAARVHLFNPRVENPVANHLQRRLVAGCERLGQEVDHARALHLDESRVELELHVFALLEVLLAPEQLGADARDEPIELCVQRWEANSCG